MRAFSYLKVQNFLSFRCLLFPFCLRPPRQRRSSWHGHCRVCRVVPLPRRKKGFMAHGLQPCCGCHRPRVEAAPHPTSSLRFPSCPCRSLLFCLVSRFHHALLPRHIRRSSSWSTFLAWGTPLGRTTSCDPPFLVSHSLSLCRLRRSRSWSTSPAWGTPAGRTTPSGGRPTRMTDQRCTTAARITTPAASTGPNGCGRFPARRRFFVHAWLSSRVLARRLFAVNAQAAYC